MGGTVAGRLRAAGHDLCVYDAAPAVRERFAADGYRVAASLRAAVAGADVTFLCLPDGAAVEACVPELVEARPRLLIDLTSSEPAVSRRVAALLGRAGIAMVDSPVSGGVAGAQAGRLTAIVGGDQAVVEEAREWLAPVAATVLWAGPVGSGDAAKAVNNALSAASLTLTAEMFVVACRSGADPAAVVEHFNAGAARSQNSEVKFRDQILTGRYGAGFTAGLMLKDVTILLHVAADSGRRTPFTNILRETWAALVGSLGPQADFTRIVDLVEAAAGPRQGSGGTEDLAILGRGLELGLAVATWELLDAGEHAGLDRGRLLAIVNASSGRNEWTLGRYPGPAGTSFADAVASLGEAVAAARRQAVPVPLTVLAASISELATSGAADSDLSRLRETYASWSTKG